MSTVTVTLVQVDGEVITIEDAPVGESLMEVARSRGVDGILGDCGGGCACATCHVYVDPAWEAKVGKPDDIEEMTLDMVSHVTRDNSRLSCQIKLAPELDGLRVNVAPAD
ncbi:2Fe-2S iron-sulfur cluster binding domain-containing protein [Mangrovimicrobium sediminis]|uniref:2Fe-2S iron-sulfur cluster binding domain-containing protein n=1 Tax=Mangrovimicrobium sediminis TaxID=2562682 RepID=A0A4Z0LVN9_9GAMM|nr:2Fe-2S iron-sulfur cluster-binding protein [Haliea sp. SAOS-164]TGD71351.1 2Fe-2S iron-sulfur cluster binding domain-containing protein [Haliea sp. SAOS-164]